MSKITIKIDGMSVAIDGPCSVAAALAQAGITATRRSVTGRPRQAFCGMGQCQECRVTIDGRPERLGCMTPVLDGMTVETQR